jgi:hypothetical protein
MNDLRRSSSFDGYCGTGEAANGKVSWNRDGVCSCHGIEEPFTASFVRRAGGESLQAFIAALIDGRIFHLPTGGPVVDELECLP